MRCGEGHSFDVARQGYLSLLAGEGTPHAGDTAEMVAARERFLGAGHFEPLAEALADRRRSGASRSGGPRPPASSTSAPAPAGTSSRVLDRCPARAASRSTSPSPPCAAPLAPTRASPPSPVTSGGPCRSATAWPLPC